MSSFLNLNINLDLNKQFHHVAKHNNLHRIINTYPLSYFPLNWRRQELKLVSGEFSEASLFNPLFLQFGQTPLSSIVKTIELIGLQVFCNHKLNI